MTFGVYEDYPPFSFVENGAPAGIDIDLGRIIAGEIGIAPRFELVPAGENVDSDLRTYLWQPNRLGSPIVNVLLHVPYDADFACRNEMVVITGQYFDERIAIAYDPKVYPDKPPSPAYFRFDKVRWKMTASAISSCRAPLAVRSGPISPAWMIRSRPWA